MTLQVVFLVVFAYQFFYLYRLYHSLYATASLKQSSTKAPRSDISAYKQAVDRFQAAKFYSAPEVIVQTPFKIAPKSNEEPF